MSRQPSSHQTQAGVIIVQLLHLVNSEQRYSGREVPSPPSEKRHSRGKMRVVESEVLFLISEMSSTSNGRVMNSLSVPSTSDNKGTHAAVVDNHAHCFETKSAIKGESRTRPTLVQKEHELKLAQSIESQLTSDSVAKVRRWCLMLSKSAATHEFWKITSPIGGYPYHGSQYLITIYDLLRHPTQVC